MELIVTEPAVRGSRASAIGDARRGSDDDRTPPRKVVGRADGTSRGGYPRGIVGGPAGTVPDMSNRPTSDVHGTPTQPPVTGLSPAVRTVVTDWLPPRDRSLAACLCSIAGQVGADGDEARRDSLERILEPIANAVATFEGYVRVRGALLADAPARPADRDAAVLASDHLHAAAYAAVSDAPVDDGRTVALIRTLIRGSTALAAAFHDGPADADSGTSQPDAVLAATAVELGAVAVDATDAVGEPLERYGRSLGAALAAHPSTDAVREAAVSVLSDRSTPGPRDAPKVASETGSAPSAVARHLEAARGALWTLERTIDDASRAEAPLDRLERATRVPFGDRPGDDD